MLFPELVDFINFRLPTAKLWPSEDKFLGLQVLKPPIVDVADPFDILFNLLPFGKQSSAYVIGVEDEHPLVSAPLHDYLDIFLDEAPKVCKLHLHPLIDDLSY